MAAGGCHRLRAPGPSDTGPYAGWLRPVYGGDRFMLLIVLVGAGVVLQITNQFVTAYGTQVQVDTGQRMVYDLRRRLFHHLTGLGLHHHITTSTADAGTELNAVRRRLHGRHGRRDAAADTVRWVSGFDYKAPAELYASASKSGKRPLSVRCFTSATTCARDSAAPLCM